MTEATFSRSQTSFFVQLTPIIVQIPMILRNGTEQGNLLKGIVSWFIRREGIEPIKRAFTYVLFSVTHSLYGKQNDSELHFFST